jgi:protoporphyrinogen oxidase
MRKDFDAIIIGAGLSGLTAATFLAKGGMSVAVLEKASHIGGRAITETERGFSMNLGPHALYKGGEAFRILNELGVQFSGQKPSGKFGFVIKNGKLHRLPYHAASLMKTTLLDWKSKWELLRFLSQLPKLKTEDLQEQELGTWLINKFRSGEVRDFIAMITRVATYTNDPDHLSAGAALEQLKIAASGNVLYIDGGWQVLVDGLRSAAETAGVKILTQSKAAQMNYDTEVHGIRLANAQFFSTKQVVLATGPLAAAELLSNSPAILSNKLRTLVPVTMACLTIGVRRLPAPDILLAFGYDPPLYFSVHSNWARLTQMEGSALIHAGKYLRPDDETTAQQNQAELEEMLDLCQPGWRDEVIVHNYLPRMRVSNSLVMAEDGGMKGRHSIDLANVRGLHFCGDWVGRRGMLCDAGLASAKEVAQKIIHRSQSRDDWKEESFDIARPA